MRCKTMSQGVRGDALSDLRHDGRRMAGPVELARRDRLHRIAARKQPSDRSCDLPPVAQIARHRNLDLAILGQHRLRTGPVTTEDEAHLPLKPPEHDLWREGIDSPKQLF